MELKFSLKELDTNVKVYFPSTAIVETKSDIAKRDLSIAHVTDAFGLVQLNPLFGTGD